MYDKKFCSRPRGEGSKWEHTQPILINMIQLNCNSIKTIDFLPFELNYSTIGRVMHVLPAWLNSVNGSFEKGWHEA